MAVISLMEDTGLSLDTYLHSKSLIHILPIDSLHPTFLTTDFLQKKHPSTHEIKRDHPIANTNTANAGALLCYTLAS